MGDRKGDWIETFTGRQFWPLDPRPEDIHIFDVAHALAHICRFTGHCRFFYSVAEHSVRVSRIVPEQHAKWGLLHDASEAYLHDLPRPLKHLPEFAAYREAEKVVMSCVCQRFKLDPVEPKEVREADVVLLATEARDLMPQRHPWEALPDPLFERIKPCSPERAEEQFLTRYAELRSAECCDKGEAQPPRLIQPCLECGEPAVWVRHTQFSGDHPFCDEHARREKNFGQEDPSYFMWRRIGDYRE